MLFYFKKYMNAYHGKVDEIQQIMMVLDWIARGKEDHDLIKNKHFYLYID